MFPNIKEYIKEEINVTFGIINREKIKYSKSDIRFCFFDCHYTIISHYFHVYSFLYSEEFRKSLCDAFNRQLLDDKSFYIEILREKNILNSQLLIGSWSNFELLISTLSAIILSPEEVNDLLNTEYDRILEVIKGIPITEKQKEKINKLKKKNLSHCPINRKYGKIFKIVDKAYSENRNIEDDKKFLDFYGRLRNCVHSNFIHYGTDFDYVFKDLIFQFRDGKHIYSDQSDTLDIDLAIELRKIGSHLIEHINYPEEIKDPSYSVIRI